MFGSTQGCAFNCLIAVATFVAVAVLSGVPGVAQTPQQLNWCNGKDGAPPDLRISGCTAVIQSGKFTGKNLVSAFNNRGIAYFDKKDYDRSIADYSAAISLDPKNGLTFNNRGNSYADKGDYDRAIADYSEAMGLLPKYATPIHGRANAYREKRELDRAIADYSEAIRLDPKDGASFNDRGVAYKEKGEYDLAIADYSEAIRLNPHGLAVYASRGEAWRLKGDLDRALSDQDAAIRLNPNASIAYVFRGDTLRYKGELARALADYDQALSLYADYIPAFVGRGLTYEKMGDFARARVEFKKAADSRNILAVKDVFRIARETAGARLAALDSGAAQPIIPAAPSKAVSLTAIPTQTITVPSVAPALAQSPRVALVIGNSAYKNVAALGNPQHDSELVAASLRAIGFSKVTLVNDTTRERLIDVLHSFASEAEKADWALVYYAGHGIEAAGINYLIPIEAKLAADRDVQFEAIPLDQVISSVEGAKKLKLILLDACRENPFTAQMRRTVATRSVGRGLARVEPEGATLVVYAAKHGQSALDGEGDNSPFASAFIQRMATPGVEINKIFRLVRDDVMEATAGRQEPFTYGSLPGHEDFFFVEKH